MTLRATEIKAFVASKDFGLSQRCGVRITPVRRLEDCARRQAKAIPGRSPAKGRHAGTDA